MTIIDTPTQDRIYISPRQLAQLFDIPLKTVYTWQSEGTGPRFARVGRHARYLIDDVHAWFDSKVVAPR